MSQQTIKQQARRTAREMAGRRRRERGDRDRRVVGLAERVLVALGERDAAVAETERRAGEELREMTEHERLTLGEAVKWCGGMISSREATRLRRLALTPPNGGPDRKPDEGLGEADDVRVKRVQDGGSGARPSAC